LLLDKSLLQRAREASEDHYEMLVTIQGYAASVYKKWRCSWVRNWHLTYFLGLAEKANKDLYGHNQLDWLNRLGATRDNLRAALDWAIETKQTDFAVQMARKLDWFWFIRSDHMEAAQALLRVLEMPDISLYPEAHAEILAQLEHHKYVLGDHFTAQFEKATQRHLPKPFDCA
jgi:predicted ATPase